MIQCLSRPAESNGRNSSSGLIRVRRGRGCRVDLGQPAARRMRLARVAGLILVATPALALTEPTGNANRPGGTPRRTQNAQTPTAKQVHSRKILRPANLRAVDRRLAQARPVALGAPLLERLGRDAARNDATQTTTYLTTRRIRSGVGGCLKRVNTNRAATV